MQTSWRHEILENPTLITSWISNLWRGSRRGRRYRFDEKALSRCIEKIEADLPAEWQAIIDNELGVTTPSREEYRETWNKITPLISRMNIMPDLTGVMDLAFAIRDKLRRDLGLSSILWV
jgi:hypothetical protein